MNQKLTPKQRKFADEYIKSGNATQAAISAGYSRRTAAVIGNENLIKPYIKSYIDKRMQEIADSKIMTATEAVELLTRIARGEEKEIVVVATPKGAAEVEAPPDNKTRMAAAKEILKRYPTTNELAQAQTRRANAEAEMAELKVKELRGDSAKNPILEAMAQALKNRQEATDNED